MNEYLYQEELYQIATPVLVVLPRPWHKILDHEKALLVKILGSVRLSMDAVLIQFQPESNVENMKALNPGKVLIFGSKMSNDIPPYQKVNMDAMALVWADDLSDLDDGKKKNLWLALRQMFGL
jgi:hypothetical protein